MANDLTSNPLVVDTAAAAAVITSYINITKIRWVDTGADIAEGGQAIVNNEAGKRIWEHRVGGIGTVADLVPNIESDFIPWLSQKGLTVPTLSAGTLHIYWTGKQPTA